MKHWNDKTVIVTGAGTGVGRAVAMELARRGAIVYATARTLEKAQPVADELAAEGFRAIPAKLDVREWEDSKRVIAQVVEAHGKLDVLINNAAVLFIGEFFEMSEASIERLVHTNLTSVLVGTLHAYQVMKEQGHGTIVNVSSLAGVLPNASMVVYGATKHGLVGLTTSLAAEAEAFGVDVKVVCLGLIESEMLHKAEFSRGNREAVLGTLPMKPMPAAKAAQIFVDKIAGKERMTFLPWYAGIFWRLQRLSPSLLHRGALDAIAKYRAVVTKD
ncbi:MAG: SDR family oxidoreductase [Polyangiales bacterium]